MKLYSRGYTACDGDAIFWKLSRRQHAVAATLGDKFDKVRDFVAKKSTH